MSTDANACPICARPQPRRASHPRYLCAVCSRHTTDGEWRRLRFYNPVTGGGLRAVYADTGEVVATDRCFVQGVPCRATELRFGGVVVQAVDADLAHAA